MRRISWTGAVLAAALALPAAAQAPEATSPPAAAHAAMPDDPDATLVEELVVTARLPGPAWWKVTDGASTVYVLGTPSLAPKHMQWDRSVFDRRLAGASEVILPFQDVRVTLKGALGATVNILRLRSGTDFEKTLDPATRARFAAARERLGEPANRYKTKNALAAGLLLASDYREHENLTTSDPTKLIKLLAQRSKVPIKQRSYDLGPLMGQVLKTPRAAADACLDEVLAQTEAGPSGTLAAARAWAAGDVRGALSSERSYERCLAQVPGARAFDDKIKADQAAAIIQALKTPGHAIAVVQLRPLLSQGGVLDRLRAKGFTIETPDAA
ncbi:TraB/GumN family protein [Phenylobacterium sp.]|uniref:TraB/GumN family protein n=1 Tax=Phenylobacterium sp. TaxID=1871053 RepID=UPI0035B10096